MTRDFHLPGRSPVYAADGMAATSHPLATLAALDALRAGGTAADAAVTAAAALGVLEPQMTGIGGDCFCLVAKPGKPVWGYNGSGRAGAAARAEALVAQGMTDITADSVHSVTVPGAVEAWAAVLKAHGRFGLDRALAPAIRYAEEGMPVAPRVATDWDRYGDVLRRDRHAFLGVADGGRERAVEPEAAVRLEDRAPRLDRTRHRNRVDQVGGDPRHALRDQRLGARRRAGAARAVVAPDRLAGLGDEAEAVAADAGHLRLEHAERRGRRDRRIGGGAAGAQGIERRDARERMRGRHHPVRGIDLRTAGQMKIACHWVPSEGKRGGITSPESARCLRS